MQLDNRLKYPLSTFVVWHPKFAKGKDIAQNLYRIFCRDVNDPLSRGLGIPVYNRSETTGTHPIPIDTAQSSRNAIILLIDQEYLIDKEFRNYTESLMALVDDNTRIFPVSLCDEAHEIGLGLGSYQFIRASQGQLEDQTIFDSTMQIIKTNLLNDCARLLMNFQSTSSDQENTSVPPPVKLFLSHAKKDGEETTLRFKYFVESKLKLKVFFDTVDIADGYEFEQQIVEHVKNSALVVFHTDEYSTREWCRIEVLVAKRNKCSMVVVHDIKKGEKRAFPYLGNTPTITLLKEEEQSFYEIVNLTLYQVINNLYQRELLEGFEKQFPSEDKEFITITSPPELFNYIDIYKKKEDAKHPLVILYPEPPLGAEELRILNDIDQDIKFITPILLPTLQ
jgi:hypothetical protein